MRRLFLPPEGRAWWIEPSILVVMAVPMLSRGSSAYVAAAGTLGAAIVVALYNRYG